MAGNVSQGGNSGGIVRQTNFCCRPPSIKYNKDVQDGKADFPQIETQLRNVGDIDEDGIFVVEYQLPAEGSEHVPDAYIDGEMYYWENDVQKAEGVRGLSLCTDWDSSAQACAAQRKQCCAPYTQKINVNPDVPGSGTLVAKAPPSGRGGSFEYNSGDFEIPSEIYVVPTTYSTDGNFDSYYRYENGDACEYGTPVVACTEVKVTFVAPALSDEDKTKCTDSDALNNGEDTKEACEFNQCCKYAKDSDLVVECSSSEANQLEIQIATLDAEIEVLERQQDRYAKQRTSTSTIRTFDATAKRGSNPDSQIYSSNQLNNFTNEGVYIKGTTENLTGNAEDDFSSFGGNSDFNDVNKWNAIIDSESGIVSFELNDVDVAAGDSFILSQNSTETSGANLYKEFCVSKGYSYDYYITIDGKEVLTDVSNSEAKLKCVDNSYITCDAVTNIKMVFGANQWDGFYIPQEPDEKGETEVNISLDVMVRFNADTLLNECLEGGTDCGVPYVDVNSVYDTECQNYVVFTNSNTDKNSLRETKQSAAISDAFTGQINWLYSDQEKDIWNNPRIQREPTTECCSAIGGTLVSSNGYLNSGEIIQYNDIRFSSLNNSEYWNKLSDNIKLVNSIIGEVNDCGVSYETYTYPGCESNYSDLITTTNICSITPDDNLLGHTAMVQKYDEIINQLANIRDAIDVCTAENIAIENEVKDLEIEETTLTVKRNESQSQLKDVNAKRTSDRQNCDSSIKRLTEKYNESTDETEAETIKNDREDRIQECEDIESANSISISQLEDEITKYNECIKEVQSNIKSLKLQKNSTDCCNETYQAKIQGTFERVVGNSTSLVNYTKSDYDEWKNTLERQYSAGVATDNDVYQFMSDTTIDFTLEVDNNLGTSTGNKVTKYKTLNNYKQEAVWNFNGGSYSGVLLEGSKSSIDGVKLSVQDSLGDTYTDEIFDAQWQTITLKLDEQDCKDLLECYPNKQFFIGLTINNEKNCETTLLVDNIKIDNSSYIIKNMYSLESLPSFNLQHTIDDKKSWIFNDDLTKVQNRYNAGLEYRYSDYDVNHSKLVLNSKETSFRIDPANAVECDVYNFWQEVDCDECNTLFSCTTATTLTYTNPTGGTVSLVGSSCPTFNFDGLISQIRSNYSDWKDALYNELADSSLVRNMSYTVIDETKGKPKGSQKVSRDTYVNDLFNKENIKKYGVSYYLPESLGVGFDIQTTQCSTNIIEIKNNDNTYTLLGEETDGTISLYSFSADTNSVCEITGITEQYCFKIAEELNHTFKLEKDDYKWSNDKCRWKSEERIGDDCDCGTSDYGSILKQSNVIIPGVTTSGTTTLEEVFGLDPNTDIFVFYDATSNSLSNIRIQSAHIYRWWLHYIQGGELVDIPEGETYTGKLRQYAVVGKNSGGNRDPQGERWLAWASYPWTGRFLSVDDGDNTTNHGLLAKNEANDNENCFGGFKRNKWQYGGDSQRNKWGRRFNKVQIWNDETVSNPSVVEKSVLEILYEQQPDGRWKDPITNETYDEDDSYLIKEIPGIHRSDETISVNGKKYTTGGIAPELKKYIGDEDKGVFGTLPADYQLSDPNEINRERVFMISMIDESETFYHPLDTDDSLDLDGDASHDFYIGGNTASGFTQSYVDDFNKFINVYQNNYTYFRGYNYSTLGGLKSSWPSKIDISRSRSLFALHSYAAIEGEVVAPIDFKEYVYDGDGGTLSAIKTSNPYSALTATTLDGLNKSGLKHFGWAENHQVGLGNKFEPVRIPQDVNNLVQNDSVLQYTIGPSGTTAPSLSAICTDVAICVNPLDYLDKQPSEVNIKPNFDEMVLSNLIDVKSRQVISGYPLLQMFYNQYLNSKGCGSSISNNLNVNTTFEVMDLIGDYWTDIIEQVVPATTIWDGQNNSGKVYRNTIFEQQKYPYRRYTTNYFDGNECSIDGITQSAFAYTTEYVGLSLIEYCQKGDCLGEEVIGCNNQLKTLKQRKIFLEGEISRITGILNKEAGIVAANSDRPQLNLSAGSAFGRDLDSNEESACQYTQEEIDTLDGQKTGYQSELVTLNGDKDTEGSIAEKQTECDGITSSVSTKNDEIVNNITSQCEPITVQITEEEEKLTTLTEGTLSYQRQKDWVNVLRNRYQNCVRKQKASQTQYNTIFITQMMDSNEYEGDVSVFGDPEWESCVELIHECDACDTTTEEEETA